MSRKPKKGYYVKGQFIAEGSELDLQLKAELKGTDEASRTDLKKESDALQKLGESLLTLRADLLNRLELPDKLFEAVAEAKRITNFEGKRRQMQFIGKLMRKLEAETVESIKEALEVQQKGSASEKERLHVIETWRDRLIDNDEAFTVWMATFPETDSQALRSLIRQARKDGPTLTKAQITEGLAPRQSRAYRELFQLIKAQLNEEETEPEDGHDEPND
jgi:ribosome-associated protein